MIMNYKNMIVCWSANTKQLIRIYFTRCNTQAFFTLWKSFNSSWSCRHKKNMKFWLTLKRQFQLFAHVHYCGASGTLVVELVSEETQVHWQVQMFNMHPSFLKRTLVSWFGRDLLCKECYCVAAVDYNVWRLSSLQFWTDFMLGRLVLLKIDWMIW